MKVMSKFPLLCIIFMNISQIAPKCILLSDCPIALKYTKERRDDPAATEILRNAHCNLIKVGAFYKATINCDQIPDFDSLPEGCVDFDQCPEALALNQTKNYEILKKAACGYNGRKDKIVCKNLPKNGITTRIATSNLLPSECGLQDTSAKIVGGDRATFEDMPWMALLKYTNATNHTTYQCHGSLISSRYVITAAHCLSYSSALRRKIGNLSQIVLGEYDITTKQDCYRSMFGNYCIPLVQEVAPESIIVHEKFGSDHGVNDIALIRLNKDVDFTVLADYVRPVCLPFQPIDISLYNSLKIGGWGKTETKKMSTVKLKATISYHNPEECLLSDPTLFCAKSPTGADTCRGDSGGPVMIYKQSPDKEVRAYLVGIVSGGGRCGFDSAFYTNVTIYVKWIVDNLK